MISNYWFKFAGASKRTGSFLFGKKEVTYREERPESGVDVHMIAFWSFRVGMKVDWKWIGAVLRGGLQVDLRCFVGWIWVDLDGFGWILYKSV